MLLKIKTYVFLGLSSIILLACGANDKQENLEITDESNLLGIDSQKISAQNVFNTMTTRESILELTKNANAEYNANMLSNPDDVSKYSMESSRALNLGVYGADLNVAGIYEQTQESMLFFKCVSIIAKSIGVSNSFDENMGDRMSANQSNRDSTLSIITQAFKSADNTLRKNGRPGTSSLLIAGAWIEGLYIACQTAKETKNEPIVKEIFNQKESLDNLIALLNSSKITEEAQYIVTELNNIKNILDTKSDNVYTVDAIKQIDTNVTALRSKIISTK